MKKYMGLYTFVLAVVFSLPGYGQEASAPAQESRSGSGESGREAPGNSGSVGVSSISSRGTSEANSGRYVSSSRDGNSAPAYAGPSSNHGVYAPAVPNLQGTSFNSVNCYYEWQDYFMHLRMRYMLDAMYFSRFYRNTEPLVTPQLLKLTLREPLSLSTRMVASVDELQALLANLRAGQSVDKQQIAAKSQEIRDLAKKIRQDQSLGFVDRRLEKGMGKGSSYENLGLEAINELREMVVELHSQLKTMYSQSTTASVSVENLAQPSFESLSKGIEKLSKVVESSARKL